MTDKVVVSHIEKGVKIVDSYGLSMEERAKFDFIDWSAVEDGRESPSFFRYRGDLHYLGDFLSVAPRGESGNPFHAFGGEPPVWADGWNGYRSDSAFSGMLIRYGSNNDGDEVVTVGLVTC